MKHNQQADREFIDEKSKKQKHSKAQIGQKKIVIVNKNSNLMKNQSNLQTNALQSQLSQQKNSNKDPNKSQHNQKDKNKPDSPLSSLCKIKIVGFGKISKQQKKQQPLPSDTKLSQNQNQNTQYKKINKINNNLQQQEQQKNLQKQANNNNQKPTFSQLQLQQNLNQLLVQQKSLQYQIKNLQTELQIQQTQLSQQQKLISAQQKILQYKTQIQQWINQSQEDNKQFIDAYDNLHKNAQILIIKYNQLTVIRQKIKLLQQQTPENKLKKQLKELKSMLKIEIQDHKYKLLLEDLIKKEKSNLVKINLINKKKVEQNQLEKLKEYDAKINRLKQIVYLLQDIKFERQQIKYQNVISQKPQSNKQPLSLIFIKNNKKIINQQDILIDSSKKQKILKQYIQQNQQLKEQLLQDSENRNLKYFYKNLNKQNPIKVQLSLNEPLEKIIQKNVTKYSIQVVQYIEVTLDSNQKRQFPKGVEISQIFKKLRIRGREYYFFSAVDFKQYVEETAQQNLLLYQCQLINVQYMDRVIKSVLIPLKLKVSQLINFIDFEQSKIEKLQNAYISKIKVDGVIHSLNQNESLGEFVKKLNSINKINNLIIDYNINLKIQIISKNTQIVHFVVNSKKTIEQLKIQFQKQFNIHRQLQKWSCEGAELTDQQSFQGLKIYQCYLKIQVLEIKNLQYYGFNSQTNIIKTDTYTNFHIENDEEFQRQLEQNNFPEKECEIWFRKKALLKIFSVIKKHFRIKTALNSIKLIVSRSSKNCNLWMPSCSKKLTLFNQNYVLFNILNCSQSDLITEIFGKYKHHSPIPLRTKKQNGDLRDLRENHYWICTKSINIVSLQIKGPIKGKSTFLNEIFKTDFETSLKHPICEKTSFIKYDIYRSTKYTVDLIDVSTDALKQQQKIQLCQHANILIVHLFDEDTNQVKTWVQKNCKDVPVIYCYRDSDKINSELQFKNQMSTNNTSSVQKNFHIPEICRNNMIYHEYKICQISNQINKFIVEISLKQTNDRKWLLNKYFQKSNSKLKTYTQKLRKLQKQFSTIVNINQLFTVQNFQKKQKKQIEIIKTILQLVDIQIYDDISNYMQKMKEFARNQRTINIPLFTVTLQKIGSLLQKKAVLEIKDLRKQIEQCFMALKVIKDSQKTKRFLEAQKLYENSKQNLTFQQLDEIYNKHLSPEFQNVIKKKDYSIQNFCRILLYIYSLFEHSVVQNLDNMIKKIVQAAIKIFWVQFQRGIPIEMINGDTLEMPIKLLKQHQEHMKGKNIRVIAVIGTQNSGNSTLLNFLFGCDFLTSQGRCTSGVYSTYYDVQGQNIIGCDGILVLDTQGLFSNYQRKIKQGRKFEYNLVLFLLKVCDIVIINSRGDLSRNILKILQGSFDHYLIKYQPGRRYPHLYVVLNMKLNEMTEYDMLQIGKFRNQILQIQNHIQDYFCIRNSAALPIAFKSTQRNGITTQINMIQESKKVPTTEYYEATKKLSLLLFKTISQIGKKNDPRQFTNIFEEFYCAWTFFNSPPRICVHPKKKTQKK